jgi:hypothetical protein
MPTATLAPAPPEVPEDLSFAHCLHHAAEAARQARRLSAPGSRAAARALAALWQRQAETAPLQ